MARLTRRKDVQVYERYQLYKPYLREDLNYACVYCSLHENEFGGPRNFHVEHFRPKSLFPDLETAYSNLLYACCVCNVYKGNDWPSDDPIKAGVGYLDPCEHDYGDHFSVGVHVSHVGFKSEVARYMIERLHLNRTQLTRLRARRHHDEELQKRFDDVVGKAIRGIKNVMANASLTAKERKALDAAKELIELFYREHVEGRRRRDDPQYDLDDYR